MSQIVWNIFPLSSGWISHLTLFLLGVTVTQVSCYSFWKQTPPFFLLQCISFFPHVLPLPLHGLPRISISITKWNCPTFLCVNVTKISCTIYQLLLNGHSTLFLLFLCVDCHTFFVSFFCQWATIHFLRLFSGTVLLNFVWLSHKLHVIASESILLLASF